jgi:hypothetical protein
MRQICEVCGQNVPVNGMGLHHYWAHPTGISYRMMSSDLLNRHAAVINAILCDRAKIDPHQINDECIALEQKAMKKMQAESTEPTTRERKERKYQPC